MVAQRPPANEIEFALALGRLEGQVRELVHNVAGKAQRDEALGRTIAKLESIPEDISAMRTSMATLEDRMTALEMKQGRAEERQGLIAAFLRSPVVAWLILIGGGAWAVITDKIKL